MSVLSSRVTQQPLDCLHIFPTNQQVHDFNEQTLLQFSDTATITIRSHDQLSVQGKRKLHIPENRHLTGGLHSVLRLAVGAIVSIVKNLDISDRWSKWQHFCYKIKQGSSLGWCYYGKI